MFVYVIEVMLIPAVLNKLVAKLDKRASEHLITAKCGIKKKTRVEKSPSKFPVPDIAPQWAISPSPSVTKDASNGAGATPKRASPARPPARQQIVTEPSDDNKDQEFPSDLSDYLSSDSDSD